jgi:hypothetical protein
MQNETLRRSHISGVKLCASVRYAKKNCAMLQNSRIGINVLTDLTVCIHPVHGTVRCCLIRRMKL